MVKVKVSKTLGRRVSEDVKPLITLKDKYRDYSAQQRAMGLEPMSWASYKQQEERFEQLEKKHGLDVTDEQTVAGTTEAAKQAVHNDYGKALSEEKRLREAAESELAFAKAKKEAEEVTLNNGKKALKEAIEAVEKAAKKHGVLGGLVTEHVGDPLDFGGTSSIWNHLPTNRPSYPLNEEFAINFICSLYDDVAIRKCKAGWFVAVLLWEKSNSEAEAKTQQWRSLSGCMSTRRLALDAALSSPVLSDRVMNSEPNTLDAALTPPSAVLSPPRKPTVEELIDELWGMICPDMGQDEWRDLLLSSQTVRRTDGVRVRDVEEIPGTPVVLANPVDATVHLKPEKQTEQEMLIEGLRAGFHDALSRQDWQEVARLEIELKKYDLSMSNAEVIARTTAAINQANFKPGTAVPDKMPEPQHTPNPEEQERELNERLNGLVGKRVKATRKFHTGGNAASLEVTGIYLGNTYTTGAGTFHGVKQEGGKKNATAVRPETITFIEEE